MAKKKGNPELEELRRKALKQAVLLMVRGRWKEGLALGVLAGALNAPALRHLLSLEEDELLKEVMPLLEALPERPPRRPPPWGWTFLEEVVEAYRPPRWGGEGASTVYLALIRTAHFAPLYRAQLVRAAWDLWQSYDRPRFEEFAVALDRKAPRLESRFPFRGKTH